MSGNIEKFIIILCFQIVKSLSTQNHYSLNTNDPEGEIADFINAKGYLPNESSLPQIAVKKNNNDDVSYILSKLSDEELVKLLNEEPKKINFDLNDVVRIALDGKTVESKKRLSGNQQEKEDTKSFAYDANNLSKKLRLSSANSNAQTGYHKLGYKEIFPNLKNKESFLALKKIKDLLYNRPQQKYEDEKFNDEKKEFLFNILVDQLKALCCNSYSKTTSDLNALNTIIEKNPLQAVVKSQIKSSDQTKEFIFLILNDEIKSSNDDDLVIVNPNTLERNSSVLILGPVTSPLTDGQLKTVMSRISKELSKPEYATLLQQLSDGTLSKSNTTVMKNFIYGSETRRYIKPHRCNHQSKLARIYGGPKWLICTGYLNINTPSLYD